MTSKHIVQRQQNQQDDEDEEEKILDDLQIKEQENMKKSTQHHVISTSLSSVFGDFLDLTPVSEGERLRRIHIFQKRIRHVAEGVGEITYLACLLNTVYHQFKIKRNESIPLRVSEGTTFLNWCCILVSLGETHEFSIRHKKNANKPDEDLVNRKTRIANNLNGNKQKEYQDNKVQEKQNEKQPKKKQRLTLEQVEAREIILQDNEWERVLKVEETKIKEEEKEDRKRDRGTWARQDQLKKNNKNKKRAELEEKWIAKKKIRDHERDLLLADSQRQIQQDELIQQLKGECRNKVLDRALFRELERVYLDIFVPLFPKGFQWPNRENLNHFIRRNLTKHLIHYRNMQGMTVLERQKKGLRHQITDLPSFMALSDRSLHLNAKKRRALRNLCTNYCSFSICRWRTSESQFTEMWNKYAANVDSTPLKVALVSVIDEHQAGFGPSTCPLTKPFYRLSKEDAMGPNAAFYINYLYYLSQLYGKFKVLNSSAELKDEEQEPKEDDKQKLEKLAPVPAHQRRKKIKKTPVRKDNVDSGTNKDQNKTKRRRKKKSLNIYKNTPRVSFKSFGPVPQVGLRVPFIEIVPASITNLLQHDDIDCCKGKNDKIKENKDKEKKKRRQEIQKQKNREEKQWNIALKAAETEMKEEKREALKRISKTWTPKDEIIKETRKRKRKEQEDKRDVREHKRRMTI
jgi:hypothetical protein